MKGLFRLFILFGLIVSTASAQSVKGYDVLGVAKFCDQYLQAPRLPAVSTLMRTFGDPLPCIERDIKKGGKTDVQINLRDATCWRNKVCPPGTPSLTDWGDMAKLASKVNELAVKNPSVQFWISPYLEHDFKDINIIQKACSVSLKACPKCRCVNEPMSGIQNAGFPLELHGTKVKAWSVSGDGASMFDGDNIAGDCNPNKEGKCQYFQHRESGSKFTFGWWNALNLRCQGEKNFVPVEKRTTRPTADQFNQAYKTLMTAEDDVPLIAPAVCKLTRKVEGKEIYKPNAEKYCNGAANENDVRGDKPLLIIKKKGSKLPIYNARGKEVGCFKYYGPYEGDLHRWYVGNCSGEKPFELYKELGSEWGYVHLGGGQCLLFNSIRRMGVYR